MAMQRVMGTPRKKKFGPITGPLTLLLPQNPKAVPVCTHPEFDLKHFLSLVFDATK